ncbi:MAG TPA: DUF1697 domain-containing protein [Nocardioidaceae bacterium]|nr:DUF1697 domain-containing protein [Nocardioidaceae bacterium]
MSTYIALLRALNVGGRYYKMADLRACLTAAGLDGVESYIQTGNVRFTTSMRSRPKIERYVEDALAAGCGFDVPAILFTPAELRTIYDDALALPPPAFAADGQRRYVTFFKQEDVPDAAAAEQIAAWDPGGESARVVGRAVHIWLAGPTMEASFFGAFKKVLAPGTNRDLKVVKTLAERWGG